MIAIRHITKRYRSRQVLLDLSLDLKEGTCTGILGENGCGKSTLLSILAGTCRPQKGSFLLDGRDLFCDRRLHAACVGYVPQGTPLLSELNGLDNLRLWYRDRAELDRELSEGVLAMLGIPEFLKTTVSRMSGGMQKRLSIGCAVAHHPQILLLDEPSAALDLVCKERIYNYLLDFKSQGGTILLATHDIQELPLCDATYILKKGQLTPFTYDGNVHRLVGQL